MADSKAAQPGKPAPQDHAARPLAQRLEKAREMLQEQAPTQPDSPTISRWSSWYNR
jgi:hypothetical protein